MTGLSLNCFKEEGKEEEDIILIISIISKSYH
jgi:hypothetical protein